MGHKKPVAHAHRAWCELICNPGYRPVGKRSFSCDVATGKYDPKLQGCRRVDTAIKYTTEQKVVVDGHVWATCVCCNVKCQNWYQGGGFAKCVKGYWFHKDKCSKYKACSKPDNPPFGAYTCVYEHEWMASHSGHGHMVDHPHAHGFMHGHSTRKRRSGNDTESFNDGFRTDVWEGNEATYANQLRSLESDPEDVGNDLMEGYRWSDVEHKKMMCELSCSPGYSAVSPMAICVDGKWIIPPSYCKEDHKCMPPKRDIYGNWECRVELVGGHHHHAGGHYHGHGHGHNHNHHGHSHGRKRRDESASTLHESVYVNHDGTVIAADDTADRSDSEDYVFDDYAPVGDYFNIDAFKAMGYDANRAAGVEKSENSTEEERSEADEAADRWMTWNTKKMLVCRLNCYDGTYYQGSSKAMCDMDTGYWFPEPGHCHPFDGVSSHCSQPMANYGHYHCHRVHGKPHHHHGGYGHHDAYHHHNDHAHGNKHHAHGAHGGHGHGACSARINVSNGFMTCKPQGHGNFCMLMCHKGMKPVSAQIFSGCAHNRLLQANMRCTPGYCDPNKYHRACFGVVTDPHTHGHGHHHHRNAENDNELNLDETEAVNEDDEVIFRRRRHDDDNAHVHEDDGSITWNNDTEESSADEFGDVWFSKAVGRGSYGHAHTHLVCDLNCQPGMVPSSGNWVAKCDDSSGKWIVPPTHCDATTWTPKCNQKTVNGGYITCGHQQSGKHYSTHCHLHCYDGFVPRDPHRTKYTCNFGSGAYSPQPLGCRPVNLPQHPNHCNVPNNIGGGHWKCFYQDFDAPYPPKSRTEEWDTIKHMGPPRKQDKKPPTVGRKRRDDGDVDYFSDEAKPVKELHENKHNTVSQINNLIYNQIFFN